MRRQFQVTGTLGVLRAAAGRGLIDVPGVLERLRAMNFYLDEALIEVNGFSRFLQRREKPNYDQRGPARFCKSSHSVYLQFAARPERAKRAEG